jgi:hypothetical protein
MINIRKSAIKDIKAMVLLSEQKRSEYAEAQPQFLKKAKNANEIQEKWFEELLERKDYFLYVAEEEISQILGFIIGRIVPAPEVYSPGGMTMMIDDFCVKNSDDWDTMGTNLIDTLRNVSKNVAQLLVVCGAHDEPKRKFLKKIGLSVASEWYVGAN